MRAPIVRALLLVCASLPGCIDSDMTIDLKKDGTGSQTWNAKTTAVATEALKECLKGCREACKDPEGFKIPDGVLEPDARDIQLAEKAGLVLKEWKSGLPDEFWTRGRAEFSRFSSLNATRHFKSGKKLYSLRRDDQGVYEMTVRDDTKASLTGSEAILLELMLDERYADPIERATTVLEKDMRSMKFLLTITVPGEIAECESPGEIERTAPGTVRVDLGMAAARAKMERLRKEGKSKRFRAGDPTLVLKFRMPEGESIPAEKLTEPEAPRGK